MEPLPQIPKELYYWIGGLVATNVGALVAFGKALLNREINQALTQKAVQDLTVMYGKLETKIDNLEKDVNAAFRMIKDQKE